MRGAQREKDQVAASATGQADECLKVGTEIVAPFVTSWDVHCTGSRWWFWHEPHHNQKDFKSRDVLAVDAAKYNLLRL